MQFRLVLLVNVVSRKLLIMHCGETSPSHRVLYLTCFFEEDISGVCEATYRKVAGDTSHRLTLPRFVIPVNACKVLNKLFAEKLKPEEKNNLPNITSSRKLKQLEHVYKSEYFITLTLFLSKNQVKEAWPFIPEMYLHL